MLRSLLPALAVVALAACDGNSTHSEDRFVANRAIVRVQKDESGEVLKLDAPVTALQVVSALDASRGFTAVVGGDLDDDPGEEMSPMLALYLPGALAPRAYPVGLLDETSAMAPPPEDGTSTYGVVAAAGNGGKTGYFATTGGSVEVVSVDPASGQRPGHLRARLGLELREVRMEPPFGFGSNASGDGTVDGLLVQVLASDADLSFSGAFTGVAQRELLGGVFGGMGGSYDWTLLVGPRDGTASGLGSLDLHLARIPAAGETIRFSPVAPRELRARAGTPADTVSGAILEVFDTSSRRYLSTAGQLHVESATPDAARGTLTLTLTELDASGRLGTRTVTATGRVGLSRTSLGARFTRAARALLRTR